eukprot:6182919-Lingulodinium_polyedra.AAC.1
MECARVRFASHRGGGRWVRAHFCVAFFKLYTQMRSNPLFAGTAACNSHASRAPRERQNLVCAWCA